MLLVETHHVRVYSNISLSELRIRVIAKGSGWSVGMHAMIADVGLKVQDGLDGVKVNFALEANRIGTL